MYMLHVAASVFSVLSLVLTLKPSWTLYIQVMTFEQAEKFRWNPFDLTKVLTCIYIHFHIVIDVLTLV